MHHTHRRLFTGLAACLVVIAAALTPALGSAATIHGPGPGSALARALPPPSHAKLTFTGVAKRATSHPISAARLRSLRPVYRHYAPPPDPGRPKGARNPEANLHLKPMTPVRIKPAHAGAASPGGSQSASAQTATTTGTTIGPPFKGLADPNGFGPSDVGAAAGTSDVVETVNESWAVYSKSGSPEMQQSLANLFSPLNYDKNCAHGIFDPHSTYETWNNHYGIVADDCQHWLLAVSLGQSATSGWCTIMLPATTASGQFPDYPEIGFDQRYFYLTMVDYVSPTSSTQADSVMAAVPLSAMESNCGKNFVYTEWSNIRDPGTAPCPLLCLNQFAFRISPAADYDSTSYYGYMADAYPGGGSDITVYYVNDQGSPKLSAVQVGVPSYSDATSAAQPAPPPGNTAGVLQTESPTLTNSTKTGGELYLALTSGYNWGNGNNNSTVNWMQINTDSPANIGLDLAGSFGYPGLWYFNPSSFGSPAAGQYQVFNFAASGSTLPVSAEVASVDYTSSVTSIAFSYQGTYPYTGLTRNDACSSYPCYRWGDFTSLLDDPVNLSTLWAAADYANDTYNQASNTYNSDWATQINQVYNNY